MSGQVEPINNDEQPDDDLVFMSAASQKKRGRTKKVAGAKAPARPSDYDIANMTMDFWAKPLAYRAGEFWSHSGGDGWAIAEGLQSKCDEFRGSYTGASVMRIIESRVKIPDATNLAAPACYWQQAETGWIPLEVADTDVVFSNGILDTTTGVFRETGAQIIFGPSVSLPYDPDIMTYNCPEFDNLLESALPDPEHREYLQKICGMILQPHSMWRGQIVFHGVTHSGKSTLATAIACAPGGASGSSFCSENKLASDKWAPNMLLNKFANVSNDSANTVKWENWMKEYTSGTYTAEAKHCKPITVMSTAKLITTCNEFQQIRDTSGAAEGRYAVFRFNNPIAQSNNPRDAKYMTPTYWSDPDRRTGILSWMLRGLIKLQADGLVEPESLRIIKRKSISEGNEILGGLIEYVDLDPNPESFLRSTDIFEALGVNSRDAAAKQVSSEMFRLFKAAKVRVRPEGEPHPVIGYRGVRLK